MIVSHCKNQYYREYAYKTVPGIDKNMPELVRWRNYPIDSNRKIVSAINNHANRPGQYITVYSFTELIDGRINYNSAVIDRIYLDFDCKRSPQQAINEAILARNILRRYGIHTHSYFSGCKGIAMYIEFKPVSIQHKKKVLAAFFDILLTELHKYGMGRCMDKQVRGDIARVSRIPNTKHASGLYCIPLTMQDMHKGLNHIREIAKNKRVNILLGKIISDVISRNNSIATILTNLDKSITMEIKQKELKQAIPYQGTSGVVTDDDIVKAKGVPLSGLISGSNKIICPFHSEDHPSFTIDHNMNTWKCWGCGKWGDAITYVMLSENITFKQAVKKLVKL